MRTESANYGTERVKLRTAPVYCVRFLHVASYGAASSYAFSRDFSSGTVASSTKTKLPYIVDIAGGLSTVVPEQGHATVGAFTIQLLDRGGEVLRHLSAPPLTLQTAMTAGSPTGGGYVEVNEDTSGMPAIGTLEITTGGVIERVRYDLRDDAGARFRVATAGRGADSTTAAVHNIGDAVTNGEQIRPGQRVQFYAGYAPLAEADYMLFATMEVRERLLSQDGVSYVIQCADIQRTLRQSVFLEATDSAPVVIEDNPINVMLKVLTSTGTGGNGAYDTLAAVDGLAVPQGLVDITGLEALRDANFVGQTYRFRIPAPAGGKAWIEEQVLRTLNCYPYAKQDGKLSARRYQPAPAPGSVTETLTTDDLISYAWQAGDGQIINRVLFEYDWDLESAPGAYGKRRLYTADASITKHGARPTLVISAQGLRSAEANIDTMLDDRALQIAKRFANPPPVLQAEVFYRKHAWEVGDHVKITCPHIPNVVTGARGLTNEVFEIINMQPRFGVRGGLALTLLDTEAITIPPAPTRGTTFSPPVPANPTAAARIAADPADTYLAGDGTVLSSLVISVPALPASAVSQQLLYRKNGDANWMTAADLTNTTTQQLRIADLTPGAAYEVATVAVGKNGTRSSVVAATSSPFTAPQDTTAPAVLSSVAVSPTYGGLIVSYAAITETDFEYVEAQRSTTNDRATATTITARGDRKQLVDAPTLADDTAYYYWLRAVDRSANASAWHAGDTAGATGRTNRNVPYVLTQDTDVFPGTTIGSTGVSAGVDQASNELDVVYIDALNDIVWGELALNATKVTDPVTKFTGTYGFVAAVSDSTDDLQVAASDGGTPKKLNYGRLDKDGAVEQAMVARFSDSVNDDELGDIAVRGSTLFWAWRRAAAPAEIRFGTTNLSGTIATAATDLGDAGSGKPCLCVDGEDNSHLFWNYNNDVYYAEVASDGTILTSAEVKFTEDYAPLGVVFDTLDQLHLFALSYAASGSSIYYARLNKSGTVLTPFTLLHQLAASQEMFPGGVRMDSRTETVYLLMTRDTNDDGTPDTLRLAVFARANG